ncbi:MAG TPA: hypothetical protein VKB50_17835 [Vicinamibacterales bacterium]|nr:hypothetical protein [Vicinamibacterales bacterium]
MSPFEDRINEVLNRTFDALRSRVEADLEACRTELTRAASQEGTRIASEAAEITAETKRAAERQLAEWRETATREAKERERSIEARERHAEAREHDAESRERDADTRRQEAEARQQATEKSLEDLRRSLDESRQQGRVDVDTAKEEVEAARRDAEAARREAASAREDVAAVRHEIGSVRSQLEQARRQLDERLQQIDQLEQDIFGFLEALDQAARLPAAIRELDRAGSLHDALDGLVQFAAREAGRAAVFVVKGDRVNQWRSVGFGSASGSPLEVHAGESLFAEALRGERAVSRDDALPAFAAGAGSRYAIATPLTVGGAVVAILYADGPDADKKGEPLWPARLDVLARYAGRMLESITIRQAAGLSVSGSSNAVSSKSDHPPAGSVQ